MTDENLSGGGDVDGLSTPSLQQLHARILENGGVAAEAVLLLQQAQGEGLELGCFV